MISRFEEARLHRLRENFPSDGFVSGHDFSRADKSLILDRPSGLQSARRRHLDFFRSLFSRAASYCHCDGF